MITTMQTKREISGILAIVTIGLVGIGFELLVTTAISATEPTIARPTAGVQVTIDWAKVRPVKSEQPIPAAKNDWTVVCFLGTECPLTRLCGQRLSTLSS